MKNVFNRYIKTLLKSRYDWRLIYRLLHYFPMFSKKFYPVKRNFFPTSSYNWLLSIPVYIFRRLKRKKNWGHSLALKVLIRFKIELVYSTLKPVIWKFNFSNSLNVEKSSRNVKFDSYWEKENHLFTFNMIKLVLFWHKFYY